MVLSVRRAIIMATAIPSSPPSVVRSARSQSPSLIRVMGSFSMLMELEASFSRTISI